MRLRIPRWVRQSVTVCVAVPSPLVRCCVLGLHACRLTPVLTTCIWHDITEPIHNSESDTVRYVLVLNSYTIVHPPMEWEGWDTISILANIYFRILCYCTVVVVCILGNWKWYVMLLLLLLLLLFWVNDVEGVESSCRCRWCCCCCSRLTLVVHFLSGHFCLWTERRVVVLSGSAGGSGWWWKGIC